MRCCSAGSTLPAASISNPTPWINPDVAADSFYGRLEKALLEPHEPGMLRWVMDVHQPVLLGTVLSAWSNEFSRVLLPSAKDRGTCFGMELQSKGLLAVTECLVLKKLAFGQVVGAGWNLELVVVRFCDVQPFREIGLPGLGCDDFIVAELARIARKRSNLRPGR